MEFKMIPKEDIEPSGWNPRSNGDQEKLEILKQSIKGLGLVEPIIVRTNPDKKNKYLITAGERRYNGNGSKLLPCIVRDETELDAKIVSLVENYVREQVSDADHEKFISDIYNEGVKQKKWVSARDMREKTGIPQEIISNSILAYSDRKSIRLEGPLTESLSTSDMIESRPLKEKPSVRKKLLNKRSKGEIKKSGHVVREISKELDKLPEDVAGDILDHDIDVEDIKKITQFTEEEQQRDIWGEVKKKKKITSEGIDAIIERKKEITKGKRKPEIIIKEKYATFMEELERDFDATKNYGIGNMEKLPAIQKKKAIYIVSNAVIYWLEQLKEMGGKEGVQEILKKAGVL